MSTADPTLVAVAGDWHGNGYWASRVIKEAASAGASLLLQCGDFGIWPGSEGRDYLAEVDQACRDAGLQLWFVDGNHEWFPWLLQQPVAEDGLRHLTDTVAHIPRGHRWSWHERTWLGLGGAVSVDRPERREGSSWWLEEEITVEEADRVIHAGRADVVLAHDCPAGVPLGLPPLPTAWGSEESRANEHRVRLLAVLDSVQPRWLIHGHYHYAHRKKVPMRWGDLEVTGLDCDGGYSNWAILDVSRMSWRHSWQA